MTLSTDIPEITIILPTHNRPILLEEAIKSVQSQTYKNWKLIIIDDASDPPVSIKNNQKISTIRNSTSIGGAGAKNVGIIQASGDLIAYLDDDDLYDKEYLSTAVQTLLKNPEVDVVFMGVSWFGERAEAGQQAYEKAMAKLLKSTESATEENGVIFFSGEELFKALLQTVPMAFQRPVVRSSALKNIGHYQKDILLWDCDWAIRASLCSNCALIRSGLYLQRVQGQGFSSQPSRKKDHFQSNLVMKERLLSQSLTSRQRKQVNSALAELWFSAAWAAHENGDFRLTIRNLLHSAAKSPSKRQFKLAIKGILKKLGLTLKKIKRTSEANTKPIKRLIQLKCAPKKHRQNHH